MAAAVRVVEQDVVAVVAVRIERDGDVPPGADLSLLTDRGGSGRVECHVDGDTLSGVEQPEVIADMRCVTRAGIRGTAVGRVARPRRTTPSAIDPEETTSTETTLALDADDG